MDIQRLLANTDLEHSVIVGYYGGGNYGDELLLEVLQNLLAKRGVLDVTVTYQNSKNYAVFHRDFGYKRIEMYSKPALARAVLRNKNIIVGGGGLWGMDFNPNILLLSGLLFLSRWFLNKKIYLLGVGYYNSTSKLGHLGAWFAAKAATHIIARDSETYRNFQKLSRHVSRDTDMAWQLPQLDLSTYQTTLDKLDKSMQPKTKTLFITLRRLRGNFTEHIAACLSNNQDKPTIVALMEPKTIDPEGYRRLEDWRRQYPNVRVMDFSYNPIVLYLFFKKYHQRLALIGPQFHIIITAHLAKVPFLPIAYDNKVVELLKQIDQKDILPIDALQQEQLQTFIDDFYGVA